MSDAMWVFEQGDWVSQVLAMVSALLWSALILRAWALRAPKTPKVDTVLGRFEGEARGLSNQPRRLDNLAKRTREELASLRGLISTLVTIAPLLGLLGTVIGMVQMFSSMSHSITEGGQDSIAGGISTALVTTQLGLIIAVPGLFVAHLLNRMQLRRENDLDERLHVLKRTSS
ncbi:MAG: MotA/TolQ/ExbB proton channel family protein [Bradymonadia bacterium]